MSLIRFVLAVVALGIFFSARAEMGTGIAQDPVTLKYTDDVYQDWQEGAVLDAATGNYVVTYKGDYDTFCQVIFEPSTKIRPTLRSGFYWSPRDRGIEYRYSLKNGLASQQRVVQLIMHVTAVTKDPDDIQYWRGHAVPALKSPDVILSWTNMKVAVDAGLAPGRTLSGLTIESNDLPGLTVAEVHGDGNGITWLGDPPDPDTGVGQQINQLLARDYVPQTAVGPEIRMPTPFDTGTVLSNIQKHVDIDLVNLKRIDPAFASELDRWFLAAVAAANGGNLPAVRSDLNELHRLLEREHKGLDWRDHKDMDDDAKGHDPDRSGLIDRLAAQVLDFDLHYVTKRLADKQGNGRN
jgi:hypothetical protein